MLFDVLHVFLIFTVGILVGALALAAYLHLVAELLKASD